MYKYLNDTGLTYFWGKIKAYVNNIVSSKLDELVSGTNIKTINNQSIIGAGNLNTHAPIMEKTYENYTCAAANVEKGYIYFMNVIPTSSNYYDPWYVHYILEITTDLPACQGCYDIKVGFAGTTSLYRVFNRFYSGSYYPCYGHLMAWYNSTTKYANKETYPVKIGERIYSAYLSNTLARTYNIKVIEAHNCTVEFPDTIETYDSFYTDTNYGYNTSFNATSIGGLDNYDANTIPYLYYEYYSQYYVHSVETPLYRYKICGFDDNNKLVPVTITNRTSATTGALTPCKVPMIVSRGLIYYNSATNITDDATLTAAGIIYRGIGAGIEYFRYNFDEFPEANKTVYLKGSYNIQDGSFILDDDYYVFVPTNVSSSAYSTYFTSGKYYWCVGSTGNSTSNGNYGAFYLDNPLYYFNGTELVPVTSVIANNLGDTNTIETIKVNNTPLTPDSNKAVNIDLTSYLLSQSVEVVTILGSIDDYISEEALPSGTYNTLIGYLSLSKFAILKFDNASELSVLYLIPTYIDFSAEIDFIGDAGKMYILDNSDYLDNYNNLLRTSEKVTSISASSTNNLYPSAKLLYDLLLLKTNTSDAVTAVFNGTSPFNNNLAITKGGSTSYIPYKNILQATSFAATDFDILTW